MRRFDEDRALLSIERDVRHTPRFVRTQKGTVVSARIVVSLQLRKRIPERYTALLDFVLELRKAF